MNTEVKRGLRFALSGIFAIILLFTVGSEIPDPFPETGSLLDIIGGILFLLLLVIIFYFVSYFFWTFILRIKKQPVQDNATREPRFTKLLKILLVITMGLPLWFLMTRYLTPRDDIFGLIGGVISLLFYLPIAFGLAFIIVRLLLKSKK